MCFEIFLSKKIPHAVVHHYPPSFCRETMSTGIHGSLTFILPHISTFPFFTERYGCNMTHMSYAAVKKKS